MAETSILNSIPYLLMAPSKKIWVDYDEEADVLYISCGCTLYQLSQTAKC